MARSTRRNSGGSSPLRLWAIVAVILFLVADAILLTSALRAPSSPVADGGAPRTIPTFTPSPEPTAAPMPASAQATTALPPNRVLAALNGGTAWRASTGACPAALATPEYSTDGGTTWIQTDATSTAEVAAPQTLRVVDGSTVEMIALDEADCTPQFVKTFVGGFDYARYPNQLAAAWYIDPANRNEVHTPSGNVSAPCGSVAALAPVSSGSAAAAVLCADQTIFLTTDGGERWSQSVLVPGAVNLGVTRMGYVVATVGLPECAGVQLIALSDEALMPTPTGCLQVTIPSETLPGNVAVSEAAGTFWVWAGDEVKRSLDDGATWE